MLADLFPGPSHISGVGLAGETPDERTLEFAKENGFAIATADADFLCLADQRGAPPQVIRLEQMDYSTDLAAKLIRRYAIAMIEFEKSARAVMILRP